MARGGRALYCADLRVILHGKTKEIFFFVEIKPRIVRADTLLPLVRRGNRPEEYLHTLCDVKEAAESLNIPFFVIGATARDIILEHCHAIRPPRATQDLDIAVEVAGWNEFEKLKAALIASGGFSATGQPHKLQSTTNELDIVPFGLISADNRTIRRPPDNSIIMNIMGFNEAFLHAHLIRIVDEPPVDIHVPTIPGIAILKLISWNDSYPLRSKDAEDLIFFIEHYTEAGNEQRFPCGY